MVKDLDFNFEEVRGKYYRDAVEKNILPGRAQSNHNERAHSLSYPEWVNSQYENMIKLKEDRNKEVTFSKLDLQIHIKEDETLSQSLITQLNIYMDSKYHSKMVPVIDLIDKSKDISLDNIYITSWEDKLSKWNTYTANHRVNNTQLIQKEVEMLDMNGKKIRYFKSIAEAHRFLNVAGHSGKIFKCCENELDEAYGYRWRYASKLETAIF